MGYDAGNWESRVRQEEILRNFVLVSLIWYLRIRWWFFLCFVWVARCGFCGVEALFFCV